MLMMKESLNIQSHDNCANFPPDDGKLRVQMFIYISDISWRNLVMRSDFKSAVMRQT